MRETHTFDPDRFIACRGATLDDIADIVEDMINPYKGTLPRFFTKGEPDGSAYKGVKLKTRKETQRPPTGMYPGTIVVVLDGQQFIQPTPGGDYEIAMLSGQDGKAIRRIAAALAYARAPCVLLPPKASKYGVDPVFDTITLKMASIFRFHGVMYYQPEIWNEMQMYKFCHPKDTTLNRRLFTRLFQLLLRTLEWYAAVRDRFCGNDMITASDTGEITCMFSPHHLDPKMSELSETGLPASA